MSLSSFCKLVQVGPRTANYWESGKWILLLTLPEAAPQQAGWLLPFLLMGGGQHAVALSSTPSSSHTSHLSYGGSSTLWLFNTTQMFLLTPRSLALLGQGRIGPCMLGAKTSDFAHSA